jgi:hypothetical protein
LIATEDLISVLFYLLQFYFIFKAIAIHFQGIQYFSEETKEGPDEMTGIYITYESTESFPIKTVCISRYQHHPLAAKNVCFFFFLLSTCWDGSCVIMQKRTSGSSDRKTFAEVQDNDIARLPQFTFAKVVRTFMFFIIKITSTWPAIQRDQLVTVTAASS